jgi:thiamine pyrophosphokinase
VARAAVIVIGGAAPEPDVVEHLPAGAMVIAADSGFDHATALGLQVDLLVGDLDSISAAGLRAVRAGGVTVDQHPAEKDATDTELAIDAALQADVELIVAVAGQHHAVEVRLDHELAALAALAHPRLASVRVEAWWGPAHVNVLHGPGLVEVAAPEGSLISLVPVHGPAEGVTTGGLRYPLAGETLPAGSSRGISNQVVASGATVRLERGTLLTIEPFALGGDHAT